MAAVRTRVPGPASCATRPASWCFGRGSHDEAGTTPAAGAPLPMTRRRRLSAEERRLWAEVARGVTPLRGHTDPPEPVPEPAPAASHPGEQPPPRPPPRARSEAPPLAPVERKMLISLRRGTRAVDAVIDLHGMRQSEAHDVLTGFLRRSQAAGHAVVLVITGK